MADPAMAAARAVAVLTDEALPGLPRDVLSEDDCWRIIGNARCVIWFCPDSRDDRHPERDSVEWSTDPETKKMTPRCLVCGTTGEPR